MNTSNVTEFFSLLTWHKFFVFAWNRQMNRNLTSDSAKVRVFESKSK